VKQWSMHFESLCVFVVAKDKGNLRVGLETCH